MSSESSRRPSELDKIDAQILELIGARSELTTELGESGIGSVHVERLRLANVVQASKSGHIGDQDAEAILTHIASVCRRQVQEMRVAFLGPKYSYSHLAACKYFGDGADFAPVNSIPAVFQAVRRGDCSAGLVPIENSTDGRIVDTLGMFVRQEMGICGEVVFPIHHNLLSKSTREDIVEIQSKPQALSQCREWLLANLPNARMVEVSSTAIAAENANQQAGVAAVASIEAGRHYGLSVVADNIEDNRNNVTRFAVLGREQPAPTGDDKTSLLFELHHQPGALADAITIFKSNELNLTWIESFPAPERPSEYLFFVELSGHRDQPMVQKALQELRDGTYRLTVLGSYPKGS